MALRTNIGSSYDGFLHVHTLAILALTLLMLTAAQVVGLAPSLAVEVGTAFHWSPCFSVGGSGRCATRADCELPLEVFLGQPLPR